MTRHHLDSAIEETHLPIEITNRAAGHVLTGASQIPTDDAVMARYVLQLGRLGFVRTKTLKAFPETAYREIIRSLG